MFFGFLNQILSIDLHCGKVNRPPMRLRFLHPTVKSESQIILKLQPMEKTKKQQRNNENPKVKLLPLVNSGAAWQLV